MYKVVYFFLIALFSSSVWCEDHDYRILPTTLPPLTKCSACGAEKLLMNKDGKVVVVADFREVLVTNLIRSYSGLRVAEKKSELSFPWNLFLSPVPQKFLSIKTIKDQSSLPYLVKDIEFYRLVPTIPARTLCANFWTYKPQNQSQKTAVEWAKKFADYKEPKAAGLFITGQPGLGKTSLAVAVAKERFDRYGEKILYLDARQMWYDMCPYLFHMNRLSQMDFDTIIIDNFISLNFPDTFKRILYNVHTRKGKIIITSTVPYEEFFAKRILPHYRKCDQYDPMEPYIEHVKQLFKEVQLRPEGIESEADSYKSSWFTD